MRTQPDLLSAFNPAMARARQTAVERLRREPLPRTGLRRRVGEALEFARNAQWIAEVDHVEDVGKLRRQLFGASEFRRAVNQILRDLKQERTSIGNQGQ